MSSEWILASTVLGASFVQGAMGFGFGMISMAALPVCFPVHELVPLVSVLGVAMCVSVLWRWRAALSLEQVRSPMVGVVVGSPLGALGLASLDRRVAVGALGVVLIAVALPSLIAQLRVREAEVASPRRAPRYGLAAGLVSGLFGGAFNTGGPPLILFGSASGWSPPAFRANLQAVFLVSSAIQLAVLAREGHATLDTLRWSALGLPALLVGFALGTSCTRRLGTRRFRILVWGLLLLLAANCLWQAF